MVRTTVVVVVGMITTIDRRIHQIPLGQNQIGQRQHIQDTAQPAIDQPAVGREQVAQQDHGGLRVHTPGRLPTQEMDLDAPGKLQHIQQHLQTQTGEEQQLQGMLAVGQGGDEQVWPGDDVVHLKNRAGQADE